MVPLAGRATDDGEALTVRLCPSPGGRRLGVPAKVLLDRCSEHGTTVLVPIRWEAATLSGLFPVLDGNLSLTTLDDRRCRLELNASYRPPFAAVGEWMDRLAFHRVAEATVHAFVQLVACRLATDPTSKDSVR